MELVSLRSSDLGYALPDPVIVAAGDIAGGSAEGDETRDIIMNNDGSNRVPADATILSLGDHAYEDGTLSQFNSYYQPTWGDFKTTSDSAYCSQFGLATPCPRSRPSLGNHDAHVEGAPGYFQYFGDVATGYISDTSTQQTSPCTVECKGWYSFDLGEWHLIALNSECNRNNLDYDYNACDENGMEEWLRDDLKANSQACVLAYWHRNIKSANADHVNDEGNMIRYWRILHDYGADVVLVGHSHDYQRFARLNRAQSDDDPVNGLRYFVAGSGGKSFRPHNTTVRANLESLGLLQAWIDDNEHREFGDPGPSSGGDLEGVLKLTLHSSSYTWDYLGTLNAGEISFSDTGTESCHDAPRLILTEMESAKRPKSLVMENRLTHFASPRGSTPRSQATTTATRPSMKRCPARQAAMTATETVSPGVPRITSFHP